MPQIQAFRGIRYDLGHVGSLSDVIAPPYDVIDSTLQDQLYKQHPANVVRLILNRDEPGDNENNNRYTRAAKFYRNWRSEGVLFAESTPAVYVYHQEFNYAGQPYLRRGFMARVGLERFGEGNIYPHEETMSGPKQDRLLLTRACRANLSQIFGLYPDEHSEAQTLLDRETAEITPLEATDHLGVVHRLWPVTNMTVVAEVAQLMASKPVFIADGHHRYETACNYRDELAAGGKLPSGHPANSVLMMCVSMSDPGMIVLPTHRLFRGLPTTSSADLIAKLGDSFEAKVVAEGRTQAHTVWDEIELRGEQGAMGFFAAHDQRWVLASITPAGRERMAQVAQDHSEPWQGLGVSILHRMVMDNLLGTANLPKPHYVHLVDEVVDSLASDEFQLAALVMPATVEHIQLISQHLERMPAKSTYFYPKLLSGLVINPLE